MTLLLTMQGIATQPEVPALVHALGWTLMHFCWQGAAVAALLWCVLALLPVRMPRARYAAACLGLGLMVALAVGTFTRLAGAGIRASRELRALPIVMEPAFVVNAGADGPPEPLRQRVERALDASAPWIPAVWLAGVVAFLARLNLGLMVARRMRMAVTEPAEEGLREVLARLSERMGVRHMVRLVQSAMVQAPTVIGWLRPVVLMPVGCLAGLSAAQVEAVLAHELAHIRRHDYLVSVMQSVVEALLFYHPAVWWVSKQMRRERESCCDDVAVTLSGDRVAYARALSWLEEQRAATPEPALGANGGVLTMRIRRLLGYGESPVVSRSVAATLLVGASVLAGSYLVTVARAQARVMAHPMTAIALESGEPRQMALKLVQPAKWSQPALKDEARLQQIAQLDTGDLKPPYSTWLNQDALWLITPEERMEYMRLTSDQERDDFIARFWALRDPPGAAPNSFKEEHYARIRYTNEHFASDKHVGWRTDRGHVYIVYGKPDDVDSHPTGGGAAAYPFEVWHYRHIGGVGDNVNIEFVDTCRCGEYHYTIDRPGQPGIGPGMSSLQPGQAAIELTTRILAPRGSWSPQPQNAAPAAAAAAYTDAAQADGAIVGTIVDPTGALVARAQVMAVNTDTGVRTTEVTNNAGKYFVSGLRPGPYNVEVEAKGFKRMLQENVQVGAKQQVELDMKLSVGAENTTVSVTGAPMPPPPPPAPVIAVPAGKPSGPQRVSSGTLAGNLISKVDPVYPDEAKAMHVQGVVVLRAVIAKDGMIEKLTYISGPPPLVVSAVEAVQQWKYKPYLLNGEPTEVETRIELNYSLAGAAGTAMQAPTVDNAGRTIRHVGGGVSVPTLTYQVPPEYTPEAKQAKTEGTVLVNLIVDEAGVPEYVHVLRGLGSGLDDKAVEAVRQYKFNPSMEDGKPVPVELNVEVNFKIF